jgi:hypothetical protein
MNPEPFFESGIKVKPRMMRRAKTLNGNHIISVYYYFPPLFATKTIP